MVLGLKMAKIWPFLAKFWPKMANFRHFWRKTLWGEAVNRVFCEKSQITASPQRVFRQKWRKIVKIWRKIVDFDEFLSSIFELKCSKSSLEKTPRIVKSFLTDFCRNLSKPAHPTRFSAGPGGVNRQDLDPNRSGKGCPGRFTPARTAILLKPCHPTRFLQVFLQVLADWTARTGQKPVGQRLSWPVYSGQDRKPYPRASPRPVS